MHLIFSEACSSLDAYPSVHKCKGRLYIENNPIDPYVSGQRDGTIGVHLTFSEAFSSQWFEELCAIFDIIVPHPKPDLEKKEKKSAKPMSIECQRSGYNYSTPKHCFRTNFFRATLGVSFFFFFFNPPADG